MSLATRNYRLSLVFTVSQYTPLYWPYMYLYTTRVLGFSAAEFGLLKGIYYLTVVVSEIPFGAVADRLSRRGVMALGALGNAVACGIYVAADGFAALALAEVTFGLGTALQSGAGSALLYDSCVAERRGTDYPRLEGRCRAAGLLALTLGLPASDAWLVRNDDPVLAYLVTGWISAAGILAALAMREPARKTPRSAREIGLGALREVAGSASLRGLVLYGAGVFVLMRAANALVFNPVMERGGVPVHFWGTTQAVLGLVAAFAAWRAHAALDRFGDRAMRLALPLVSMAMYAALAGSGGPEVAGIVCLNGVAVGALPVVVLAGLNRSVSSSERRATILSVESLVSRAAYGGAAVGLAALLEHASLPAVLLATAALGSVPLALAARRNGGERQPRD